MKVKILDSLAQNSWKLSKGNIICEAIFEVDPKFLPIYINGANFYFSL